jgi:parvulin-like peptidyl-prolyl isomerase
VPRSKLIAGSVFGAIVVISLIIAAVTTGLGAPSVPSDDVAIVQEAPNEDITKAEFDRALEQTARSQGLDAAPAPDAKEYGTLRDAALSDLILARWITGEADERGLVVSETEIDKTLEQIKQQQFGGDKQFQKFLDSQGFTLQDARDRVELQLLSDRIQQAVLPQEPEVSDDDVQDYYDQNIAQFEQPETRDVRQILNKDEAQVQAAQEALAQDDSPASWKQVAKKYSTDQATKGNGGLRQSVAAGQSEPTLDNEIFSAAQGELVGPFESDSGFYLIQVEKINAATTTPLDDVRTQIHDQLAASIQQQAATDFETDFIDKWRSRTFCGDGYAIDRCSNFEGLTDACTGDDKGEEGDVEKTGCPAFVPSTQPVPPGEAAFLGTAAGKPQGPITQPTAEATTLPATIGGPGAPTPVPGG